MRKHTTRSGDTVILAALAVTGISFAMVALAMFLVADPAPTELPAPNGGGAANLHTGRLWGNVEHYALRGAELYAAGLASEGLVNPNVYLKAGRQHMSDDELAGKGLGLVPARLTAGMAVLHKKVQESGELRQRLPQVVTDSLWSVDPKEAAMGLAALRKAVQEDDELNFMVPIEMRLALQATIYAFPSPITRYYHGPNGINSPSVDAGYDQESRLRHDCPDIGSFSLESPELESLCRMAKERFVSMYPWMVGDEEWLGFEGSCRYYHSESVARFLANQLDARVSDRCKALIDAGWVVRDGALRHPGLDPEEMARALEAGGGAPGAYGRMVETGGELAPQFTRECLSPFEGTVPFHFDSYGEG